MKKALIRSFIAIVMLIAFVPLFFYIWFGIGMFSASSAKTIKSPWVTEYKTNIKSNFSFCKDTDIYQKQGRLRFDLDVDSNTSIDKCKDIVVFTRDFIVSKSSDKSSDNQYFAEEPNLLITFISKNNTYTFECPYWIQNEDETANPNESIENNYKVWYQKVNEGTEVRLEL